MPDILGEKAASRSLLFSGPIRARESVCVCVCVCVLGILWSPDECEQNAIKVKEILGLNTFMSKTCGTPENNKNMHVLNLLLYFFVSYILI